MSLACDKPDDVIRIGFWVVLLMMRELILCKICGVPFLSACGSMIQHMDLLRNKYIAFEKCPQEENVFSAEVSTRQQTTTGAGLPLFTWVKWLMEAHNTPDCCNIQLWTVMSPVCPSWGQGQLKQGRITQTNNCSCSLWLFQEASVERNFPSWTRPDKRKIWFLYLRVTR